MCHVHAGVAYGLGHNGTPVDYTKAAMYYAHACDINLQDMSDRTATSIAHGRVYDLLGPNNDEQASYQQLARRNLMVVQRKIGGPCDPPRSGFDADASPGGCAPQ